MTINPLTWYKNIKAILAVKGKVEKMKLSELKTSEGRMALLLNVIAIYSAVQGFLPPSLVAKIAVVSLAIYTAGRAIVKAAEVLSKLTPSPKDDAVVAEAVRVLEAVAPKADEPK